MVNRALEDAREEVKFLSSSNTELEDKLSKHRLDADSLRGQLATGHANWEAGRAELEGVRGQLAQHMQLAKEAREHAVNLEGKLVDANASVAEGKAALVRLQQEAQVQQAAMAAAAAAAEAKMDDASSFLEEECKRLKQLLRLAKQHLQESRDRQTALTQVRISH
jgi:chromosome segregation ATPase